MKIALVSDIHLEFGPIKLNNKEGVDVLVLSGDICVARDLMSHDDPIPTHHSQTYHEFFQSVSKDFPHVIYVAGNHEHYHGDVTKSHDILRERLGYLPNIHILEKDVFKLNDVTFIGTTLWTDMNKDDPLTLLHLRDKMNDFYLVSDSEYKVQRKVPLYADKEDHTISSDGVVKHREIVGWKFKSEPSRFSPERASQLHKHSVQYIQTVIEGKFDEKFVVVGHHAPSKQSTHPRYLSDTIMNGGYSSDLSEFIIDHPQIKVWTHGHTHDAYDYMVGDTRIVCNPRGYVGYEVNKNRLEFELMTFDV